MKKKFIVCYVPCGSEDLYSIEFDTEANARELIENSDAKSILISIAGGNLIVKIEDHT